METTSDKMSPCNEMPHVFQHHHKIHTNETDYSIVESKVNEKLAEELQKFQEEHSCDEMSVKYQKEIQTWTVYFTVLTGQSTIDINTYIDTEGRHLLVVRRISREGCYLDCLYDIFNPLNQLFNPSVSLKKSKLLKLKKPSPFGVFAADEAVISFILPEEKQVLLLEMLRSAQYVASNERMYETRLSILDQVCSILNQAKTDEQVFNTLAMDKFKRVLSDTIQYFAQDVNFEDVQQRAECAAKHMEVMFNL